MEKFRNKYLVSTPKLALKTYREKGIYFITICTLGRKHYFGEVLDGQMVTTEIGKKAELEWIKTPELRPDMNMITHNFVVMPNHFHVLMEIGENKYNSQENDLLQNAKFGPQSKNLSSIIRGYKSAVTMHARMNNIEFSWQSNFYENVVRIDEFQVIYNYIDNNPVRWKEDKFYRK